MKVFSISSDVNVHKLSQQILRNEPKILNQYPPTDFNDEYSDGGTGLGLESLTSRFFHFNVLKWWGTGLLKKNIRNGYEKYNKIKNKPLYVQCWANVMRKGNKINSHVHNDPHISSINALSGHLNVKVDGSTSTYYNGEPKLNIQGEMTFFPSWMPHWTDTYNGEEERITVAFDITSKDHFDIDIHKDARSHWVKI